MPTDYERVEQAISFIEYNFRTQPSLGEVASAVGLSEYHFQRLFKRWVGISPKRFLQFLTVGHARGLLRDGRSVLQTSYESGLSGPSRLHDLFVSVDAVTPGQFKDRGRGLAIAYGFHDTPFGPCFIATTARGVTALEFGAQQDSVTRLGEKWMAATLREDRRLTKGLVKRIFDLDREDPASITLYLKGTNFQLKVWQALLNIPPGNMVSYEEVALAIGSPGAKRAVGNAVGSNPIAFVIPCHRVIRKSGDFGDYRWGSTRKKAILAWEAARQTH